MQKVCRRCKSEKPPDAFGKSSRNRDGMQTICKPCDVAAVQASRKRKVDNQAFPAGWQRQDWTNRLRVLNEQYAKQQHATGNKMDQEAASIDLFETAVPHWEVCRWQDATKSDVGVRPIGSTIDLWLPLQMKSKSTEKRGFRLKGRDGTLPNCDVVCINLKPFWMLYIPKESLHLLKVSPCGHWAVFDSAVRNRWAADASSLHRIFSDRWHCDECVFGEETLRMQVNSKYRVEMLNIKHANMLLPESRVEWPSRNNSPTDLVRDGQREQHKSALPRGNAFEARHCWKWMCQVHVAYEVGDNDWYVFGCLLPHAFVQWRIPQAAMIAHGMLAYKNDARTAFAHPGRMTLRLHIVDEHGNHKGEQMRIVGKLPNADADCWTGQYVRVLWL